MVFFETEMVFLFGQVGILYRCRCGHAGCCIVVPFRRVWKLLSVVYKNCAIWEKTTAISSKVSATAVNAFGNEGHCIKRAWGAVIKWLDLTTEFFFGAPSSDEIHTYTHTHAYVSNRHQRDGKQNVDHLHFSVLTFLCYILEVCVNIRLAKAWLNMALALRSFLLSANWFPVRFFVWPIWQYWFLQWLPRSHISFPGNKQGKAYIHRVHKFKLEVYHLFQLCTTGCTYFRRNHLTVLRRVYSLMSVCLILFKLLLSFIMIRGWGEGRAHLVKFYFLFYLCYKLKRVVLHLHASFCVLLSVQRGGKR